MSPEKTINNKLEKGAVSHSEYLITHQAAKHIKNRNVGKTKKDQ